MKILDIEIFENNKHDRNSVKSTILDEEAG